MKLSQRFLRLLSSTNLINLNFADSFVKDSPVYLEARSKLACVSQQYPTKKYILFSWDCPFDVHCTVSCFFDIQYIRFLAWFRRLAVPSLLYTFNENCTVLCKIVLKSTMYKVHTSPSHSAFMPIVGAHPMHTHPHLL